MTRDKRSYEIKKLLEKSYPKSKFRVKIEKYSLGESIHVSTDLLKKVAFTDACWRVTARSSPTPEDYEEYRAYDIQVSRNREIERAIHVLLKQYEHVSRDEVSGEILSGGNTHLFVEPLQEE